MKKVFVECKPDQKLINFIAISKRLKIDMVHCGDKPRVLKNTLRNAGSIGIIDEDPGSPQSSLLKMFKEIKEDNDLGIRVYKGSNGSILIELRPRLEEWLLRLCRLSRINVKKHGFPSDPGLFKKIINQRLNNLEKLLEEPDQKSHKFRDFYQLIISLIH